jgi:DNA-directed RNA polymerase subunit E'/Rpb7
MDSIFVTSHLNNKIRIKPSQLGYNIEDVILTILQGKYEGKCTEHGYIKPRSIKIEKFSAGYVQAFTLNGDIIYNVIYKAEVCNPSIGNIVSAVVVNMNKFGILAEAYVDLGPHTKIPVLEIIVAKNMINVDNEQNIESISINQEINVEILGKKYELNDKKISIVGRIIEKVVEKAISGGGDGIEEIETETEDEIDGIEEIDEDEDDDEDEEIEEEDDNEIEEEEDEIEEEDEDEEEPTSETESDDDVDLPASDLDDEFASDGALTESDDE